ncbi:J domain-containing protein [Xylophilus sp. Leaf220]|uniref:J domain-containing protein n=1 Tax=Xylophilus sp. Leaf220 TaxID=1735686 RepID=UPI0012E2A91D|nr:J domain-containing protein [Xylophilus sp. Leaf220]
MNHYERLEVSPTASASVIRAAYKSLMQRHHPDKVDASAAANEYAMALAQAYRVLSNEEDRAAYDVSLRRQQPSRVAEPSGLPAQPAAPRHRARPAAAWRGPGYAWALVTVIAVSGLTLHWLGDRRGTASTGAAPRPAATRTPAPMVRTQRIHLLTPGLKVQLPASGAADERALRLTIPALIVEIRAADRDPFPRSIESRMSEIVERLSRQLRSVSAVELRIAGSDYLSDFLKQALIDVLGSPEFLANEPQGADAAASHEIVRVTLPESFILD